MTTSTTARKTTAAKKAAPAKATSARKATPAQKAETTVAPKIRWTPNGERDASGNRPAVGVAGDLEYRIDGEGDAWTATVKHGNKTSVIAEDVSGKAAWSACVRHHKATIEAAASSAA